LAIRAGLTHKDIKKLLDTNKNQILSKHPENCFSPNYMALKMLRNLKKMGKAICL